MQAVTADGAGNVRLEDVADPEPAAGEVTMAVEAFSVNRGETYLLETAGEGWRPGKDVAGTVVRPAAGGTGPTVGARVVAHLPEGGWAELACAPIAAVAELPDEVDLVTAAALPLAGLSAVRLLRRVGSLIGRRILITGASGGVGHYLVELAAAGGAEVTAVVRTLQRGARLRELGAHTVCEVAEARGWFDTALESVGGATLVAARRKVRPEGSIIWFGQAGGQPVTLDFFDWVQDTAGAPIIQFHYADTPDGDGRDLRTLVRLVTEGRLHPEIGALQGWDHTAEVIRSLRRREIRGNAVLQVALTDHRGEQPRRDGSRGAGEVMRSYLDALVAGDLDTIAASFAEDATWWLHGDLPLSGTKHGRAEIMDFLIGAGSLFTPGSQAFRFGQTTIEGPRAVLEWRVTGTGAATGRAYDNSYCAVFVVRDGRIVQVREYLDSRHAAAVLFA